MENNNDHENDNPDAAVEENDNDNDNDNDNHIDLADDADEDENENENENEAGGNNNIMVDIDLEEDEEDGDNDSTLDGGVAVNPEDDSSKAKKHSSECDLLLYVYCEESIDVAPDHPIMRPGVNISIGLDKTTKLKAVFKQYVDFCNSSSEVESGPKIDVQDVEFSFCQLLNENDTAETSALMKNDRIRVRKVRTSERVVEAERKRAQRDADRIYFHQMRHLLPESCPARVADIILDCQGKLVDNHGRNQRVLSTTVRAHSSMISKRCPWLMDIILQARQKARRLAEEEKAEKCKTPVPDQSPTRATEIENDDEADGNSEDDEIGRGEEAMYRDSQIDTVDDSSDDGKVNVIIVDDEDDDDDVVSVSRHQIQSRLEVDLLTVVLSEHSPEAVKILLEYCYTNRVVSLGHDAFVQACKTRPSKHNGPVPPYPTTHSSNAKRWPNNGIPIVPFSVALAAIKLAEEAGVHRLSLMCEISASQLISSSNVVEALTMSTRQKTTSGNDLPRLRKAAMDVILRKGRRGVSEICRASLFRKALQEERSIIVPTLLQGTMEAVAHWEKVKGVKRDSSEISNRSFKELDKEDSHKRAKERRSRRQERTEKDPNKIREHYDDHLSDFSDEPYSEEQFMSGWVSNARAAAASVSKRSLKRMAQHNMDSMTRRSDFSRGSLNFPKVNNKRSSKSSRSQKFDSFLSSRDK